MLLNLKAMKTKYQHESDLEYQMQTIMFYRSLSDHVSLIGPKFLSTLNKT